MAEATKRNPYLSGFLTVAVLAAAGLIYFAFEFAAAAPLTADLSGTWQAVNSTFNERVQRRFPIGSSKTAMMDELRREGFVRGDLTFDVDPALKKLLKEEETDVRREDNIVCRQAAYVHWRADGENRLTMVRGEYREEGCL